MPRPERDGKNNNHKGALGGAGSSAPQYCLSTNAYWFIDSVKYLSMKKFCSWLNGTQKQQGPAEKMQQQKWHGHTDIGVHLRSPRRPELGTEVRVPKWWKAYSIPIHSTNNILYLLGTRPFEAVGQTSKATMTSGSHARASTHTSTRVPGIFILLGLGELGSAIRSSAEDTDL